MFPTLLIPLALDVRDAELLAAAVTLVGTAGVKNVHLVYVHAMDVVGNPLLGGIPVETFTPAAPEGLAGLADDLRERLIAAGHSDVSVHRHHMAGRPHERITALAGEIDADLLIFGRLRAGDGHEAWGAHAQLLGPGQVDDVPVTTTATVRSKAPAAASRRARSSSVR